MDSSANTKALMKPAMKNGSASSVKYCQFLISEIRLAPAIIGTAIINVKSAAARWLIPSNTPPEMVEPERENPGQSETHCIRPTDSA
ncbi:hypothetical protein D3C75_504790 [compost metagenome]